MFGAKRSIVIILISERTLKVQIIKLVRLSYDLGFFSVRFDHHQELGHPTKVSKMIAPFGPGSIGDKLSPIIQKSREIPSDEEATLFLKIKECFLNVM